MKYLKTVSLAAVAAMALMAVTAVSALATTLEVAGVPQNKQVTMVGSAESSMTLSDTEGFQANTCSVSSFHGPTSIFTGAKVTGNLSEFSFSTCTRSPITMDAPGGMYVEWEAGSTSGSVFSENTVKTVPTTFGFSVTCATASTGTKIGTVTGSISGNATVSISAVLSCGFLLPSAIWKGSYSITTPSRLGVIS